jgi:ubiquinone/menaquinone biosynthesis C-methylase UbiE
MRREDSAKAARKPAAPASRRVSGAARASRRGRVAGDEPPGRAACAAVSSEDRRGNQVTTGWETEETLRVRIHAHTAYTDLKLEAWLLNWLGRSMGHRLLDVGCGDGNFFATYARALGEAGLIIGLDKDERLLARAQVMQDALATPLVLIPWDFDVHPFPLPDGETNLIVASFSAYYASDVVAWVEDSLRVLTKGGRLLLLGPTKENAQELYALNERVTGIRSVPEIDETSTKLEACFLPELTRRLGRSRVTATKLARTIVFPCAEEFARYFLATWLFESSCARIGHRIAPDAVTRAARETTLRLNKEIVCIEARNEG